MTPPIDQLHDILPGPIHSDIGNIVVITIIVAVSTIATILYLYKTWPRYKLYIQAKRKLKLIIKNNDGNFIPSINELLKNTAGTYWLHDEFARLHTKEWLNFLDKNSQCHFSKYVDDWAQWSYSDTNVTPKIKKEIQIECVRWLKSIRNRSPL
jgi:hypothetical protein